MRLTAAAARASVRPGTSPQELQLTARALAKAARELDVQALQAALARPGAARAVDVHERTGAPGTCCAFWLAWDRGAREAGARELGAACSCCSLLLRAGSRPFDFMQQQSTGPEEPTGVLFPFAGMLYDLHKAMEAAVSTLEAEMEAEMVTVRCSALVHAVVLEVEALGDAALAEDLKSNLIKCIACTLVVPKKTNRPSMDNQLYSHLIHEVVHPPIKRMEQRFGLSD